MTTPIRFEDRLLAQLRHVVAERPAPDVVVSLRQPRRTRFVLAGGGVAAATAVVAVIATSGGVTPSASAYSVQARPDGSVTVSIRSLSDAGGLQDKLRAAGVPAVVDYSADPKDACTAPAPGGAEHGASDGPSFSTGGAKGETGPSVSRAGTDPGPGSPGKVTSSVSTGPDGVKFSIDPGNLKPGDKVFISTSSGAVTSLGMTVGEEAPGTRCPATP